MLLGFVIVARKGFTAVCNRKNETAPEKTALAFARAGLAGLSLRPLERVPQAELHYSERVRIDARPVGEVWSRLIGRCSCCGNSKAGAARIQTKELLRVGQIEDLPAELQLMAFVVEHPPALIQSQIEIDVLREAEVVSQAGFSRIGTAEALKSLYLAVSKVLRFGDQPIAATVHRNRLGESGVALHFPVGGPLRGVVGCSQRNARVVAEDVG